MRRQVKKVQTQKMFWISMIFMYLQNAFNHKKIQDSLSEKAGT